jgi:hypothetical protein
MLIDILASEALQAVIAKYLKLQARDDLRQEKVRSGKERNAGRRRYKIKSCLAARPAPDRIIPTKLDRYKDQIGFSW